MGNKKIFQAVLAVALLFSFLAIFYFSFLSGQSYLWDDSLYVCYPGANYLATSLASGHIPLWVSGMRDGLPFYCDLAMSAMYPPLWGLVFFVSSGVLPFVVYQWYLVLQLLMGGVFTLAFLRLLGLRYCAALVGAVIFMFSAHMSLHLIHPNLVQTYLWLPLEFYFVQRIFSRPNVFFSWVGLVVSLLISFLGGFPQTTLYGSYFLVSYWAYLFWLRCKDATHTSVGALIKAGLFEIAKVGSVFLMVLLLGAVSFLPAAENWSNSSRQAFGFKEIADLSLPWYYLIHGLVPNFFGASSGDGSGIPFWGFNKDTLEYANWHAGAWMYWEFGFYAGQLALLAVAILAFNFRKCWERKREVVFFLCAVIPVLWLMLGRYGYFFDLFYRVVPGFALFRTPARIGGMLVFCLAVLGSVLVNWVLENKSALLFRRPVILIGGIYVIFIFGVMTLGERFFPELKSAPLNAYAIGQTVVSFVLCGIMLALLWFISSAEGQTKKMVGGFGLVLLCFVDLYLAFHAFHQGKGNPGQYYADRNNLISQMGQMRNSSGVFRFAQLRDGKISEELVFPRNIGYLYPDYEALEGYLLFNLKDPVTFNDIANERARLDIRNVGLIANLDSRTRQLGLMRYTNSLPRVKFYHEIRAYDDTKGVCAEINSGSLDYRHTLGVLREDCVKFNITTSEPSANATAQVHFTPVNSDEYKISYQTTAPGVIFISESYYPGWQADGGRYPVVHAFGAFKGIVIPEAGSGVITMKFSPWIFKLGLAISLITLLVLIGVGVRVSGIP